MKHARIVSLVLIVVLVVLMGLFRFRKKVPKQIDTVSMKEIPTVTYKEKKFNLDNVQGLSSSQLSQHLQLYAGYVKKRNEIEQNLKTVTRVGARNRTYSPYRSLKLAETYAVNGSILHELYFENLGTQTHNPGPKMLKLIKDSFGSLAAYKQDLLDAGGCARGWAITAYSYDDGKLHNFVLEEHNQHVPVLTVPLIVLDVYEHAYMIDFGIKRNPYLDVFWDNINWDVVEKRIERWVKPLSSKLYEDTP